MKNSEMFYQELPSYFPPQHQDQQPGLEFLMNPSPIFDNPYSSGCWKLQGKVAIITGGDSGIGRAVAVAFAKEGANVVIAYYNEHGKFPDRYSVLKSALTRSYKNMLSEVSDIIYKHKEQTGQSLDYDETFKQVLGIKE